MNSKAPSREARIEALVEEIQWRTEEYYAGGSEDHKYFARAIALDTIVQLTEELADLRLEAEAEADGTEAE